VEEKEKDTRLRRTREKRDLEETDTKRNKPKKQDMAHFFNWAHVYG